MIKVGIVGATGYAGAEIVRLLLGHPNVEIKWCFSQSYTEQNFQSIYKNTFKFIDQKCINGDLEQLSKEVDVIFTATPHSYLSEILTENILNNSKIIDLSADYRFKDVNIYEKWYNVKHKTPQFIKDAVYGLCEINRNEIKKARLIANPGCYTTCSILPLYPLVKENIIDISTIIIDAKSGVSGAGRSAKVQNLYCEVNENIKAYGVSTHRHTPEIEEQLGYAYGKNITINFTPHLIPMNRGILTTSYATLIKKNNKYPSKEDICDIYREIYGNEFFVRLLEYGECPETRWVKGSNFIDIGFTIDERTNRIIVMGALDNIIKGAAGQAIQNFNLLFGFDETTGLKNLSVFP